MKLKVYTKAFDCPAGASPKEVCAVLASLNPGSLVQTVRNFGVTNEFFLEMIAAQTTKAKATGALLANKPEVDFLLRLAGTTQISEAIRLLGSKSGARFLAIVASQNQITTPDDLVQAELGRRKLSRRELAIIEKAALLDVERG